ncbi:MAG TPA: YhcH/YjgK/YiaL family protein [Bacteroidota bacterium]|nr:YhcH/YjgK/YiaL family protein [Bacteroidota bacterium]
MILDTLSNLHTYSVLHPRMPEVIAFLARTDLRTLPDGRFGIDGDSLYASVIRKAGVRQSDAVLEAHEKYIDIQVLLDGDESIGWRARADCRREVAPFDVEKDIVFFTERPATYLHLVPDSFALFFPHDAHAPMVSDGTLHKIVVKMACQLASK